jgi:hypothetical protein
MTHASGPVMTDGLPVERTLSELVDVVVRDVRLPADAPDEERGLVITDVRAHHANGRRYRFVGRYF